MIQKKMTQRGPSDLARSQWQRCDWENSAHRSAWLTQSFLYFTLTKFINIRLAHF